MSAVDGWKGVELRHLAALAAIDEQRSFRGAADQLGYVQSAVSQQILQLEKLVGARLVDRSRGHAPPVQVTEAGRLLLAHGERIRAQLDAAQADLATLAEGTARTLRVGVLPSVASRLLPAVLAALRAADPGLAVGVAERGDLELRARVAAGELDVAFGELPDADDPPSAVAVLDDPCVLLVPVGSPAAEVGPPRTAADLVARPLVRLQGWPLLDRIEERLRAAGHPPSFSLSAEANATVQALVGARCGGAIMPRLAVAPDDPRVVALAVGDLLPPRRLALLRPDDPPADAAHAADAFAAAVQHAVAGLVHGA